jgi:hypothetical protein
MGNMNGVATIVAAGALLVYLYVGLAMEPIETPLQYGQFCEAQKVSGQGVGEVSISVLDSELALDYSSSLAGNGDFDINQVHAYSQRAEKLRRIVGAINNTQNSSLNLFETINLAYSGSIPLVGANYLSSAIGAEIEENYAVTKIERSQMAFAASTKDKSANNNLQSTNPVHTMGIDTKNSFDGTWSTSSAWHEMLSKDIKTHEEFEGIFGVEKLIKFHEDPVPEQTEPACLGVDC